MMKGSMAPMMLTQARKDELLEDIDSMLPTLLQSMRPQASQWDLNFVRNGVTCYDNVHADPYHRLCLSASTVASSLDSAMSAMATDTTSALLRAEKEALGDRVSNATVVSPLRPRTRKSQNHYIGIKWIAYNINGQQRFDLVFCDAVGTGVDPVSGRRYGYRVLRSMVLPECMPIEGLPRGHVGFNVIKFIETDDPGMLDMHIAVNLLVDDVASLSSVFDPFPQTTRLRSYVEQFYKKQSAIPARRHTTPLFHSFSMSLLDDPTKEKKPSQCALCRKKFHWFRRRHACSECSNTVCHSCVETIKLRRARRKICLVCRCTTTLQGSNESQASPQGLLRYRAPTQPQRQSLTSPIYDIRMSAWSPRSIDGETPTSRHTVAGYPDYDRPTTPSSVISFNGGDNYAPRYSSERSYMGSSRGHNTGESRSMVEPPVGLGSSRGASGGRFISFQMPWDQKHKPAPSVRTPGGKRMANTTRDTVDYEDDMLMQQINRTSISSVSSLHDWNPVDITARNSIPYANSGWTPVDHSSMQQVR
ncbi:hypothetical protein SDRG_11677 [Saprolegnia diclina VS20]|uniref:FYVE-type domain-containing protein n=1 Tax=Saprolegnia diclina (strain VS20) TaxID=1156394 RepID=T0RL18_SAPDV|nr:hypothetical protein SDRG_11677 [Saprolegnia diclina VS20]EQC30622.1 hypothetical protein SDRG_11677 [Saprolegnia diclina VS20]|eukprot:XP_008615948.1 hypothetical protein SDRG_11677 [Saprolegnia diclina VS20]